MQMVEINSKNVDSITREGKTYLYFTAGFSPFAAAMEPAYEKFLAAAAGVVAGLAMIFGLDENVIATVSGMVTTLGSLIA